MCGSVFEVWVEVWKRYWGGGDVRGGGGCGEVWEEMWDNPGEQASVGRRVVS